MATYYWVSGSGTWNNSSTTNWSTADGGTGGAGPPTSSDSVIFDTLSNATAYTLTIAAGATCANMTMGPPLSGNITIAGTNQLTIAGSASWPSSNATISFSGSLNFTGTSSFTITTHGNTITSGNFIINGAGGTYTLQDNLTIGGSVIVTQGTLTTNNVSISNTQFASNNSNTRTINLGSSVITCSTATAINFSTTTGLTLNAGTSKIVCTGTGVVFNGNGLTWYDVEFSDTSNSTSTVQGYTGHNLILDNKTAGMKFFEISGNITLSGTITCNSTAAENRYFMFSTVFGTQRTISLGSTPTFASSIDFRDMAFTGAGTPISSTTSASCGDAGDNTGITFPTGVTWYCVGTSGAVAFQSNIWSTSSGGSITNGIIPCAQDTMVIDQNTVASQLNMGQTWNLGSFSCSTRTSAFELNFSSEAQNFCGNIVLGSGITIVATGSPTVGSGFAQSINTNGITLQNIIIQSFSTITISGNSLFNNITLTQGTLNGGGFNLTCVALTATGSATSSIVIGSGTWSLSGTGTVWDASGTGTSVTGGTSGTIAFTDTSTTSKTFNGGGQTYPTLQIGGATGIATYNFTGNNTFYNMTSVKTVASTLSFANGSTNTFTQNFSISGSSGHLITLQRASSGTFTFVFTLPYQIVVNYLDVINGVASPNFTWYAKNSTDGGGNSGWIFNQSPSTGNMFLLF